MCTAVLGLRQPLVCIVAWQKNSHISINICSSQLTDLFIDLQRAVGLQLIKLLTGQLFDLCLRVTAARWIHGLVIQITV